MMTSFNTIGEMLLSVASILQPAEEMTVSQAAEKYRYVNQPGAYVGPWLNTTTPMMVLPMNLFTSRQYTGIVFVGPAQCGKALAVNTPIATPDGWTTMGALRPGDKVFDEKGQVTTVTFVTQPMFDHPCFDVHFEDESVITADADHKWLVRDDNKVEQRVVTTAEMARNVKYGARLHRNRYAVVNADSLDLPEVELPIEPYLLGVWIGDGHVYSNWLHLNSEDTEILDRIEWSGYPLIEKKVEDAQCVTVKVGGAFRDDLRALGLLATSDTGNHGRWIPKQYLRASRAQRLALLQGLMDTDACVSQRGRTEFTTIWPQLMHDIRELAASLGYKTKVDVFTPYFSYKGEKRTGQLAYMVKLFSYAESPVFSLSRQIAKMKSTRSGRPSQTGCRRIVDIVQVPSVPVCCIAVDNPTHLFLAGPQMVPTHNTDSLILNTVAYTIKVEPMDTMIVCPTNTAGRDFSIRRIDRLHRHSEKIGEMMLKGADFDNKFDKQYVNGMLLTISWPTPTELAGKPIGRIVMTDFDRMPMDVGPGDGNPYDLASKRTTTYGSYAMTLAESSPSKEILDPKWVARTPHEAPPCEGILALYNRGDRRRWYWPCLACNNFFEGNFRQLTYEKRTGQTNMEIADSVRLKCPYCSHEHSIDDREEMNRRGLWLMDGQGVGKEGVVFGPVPRTGIASFWLNGVAAAFTNWKKLLTLYLDAEDEFQRTGSQDALRKFYNNDLGEPYREKGSDDIRLPETLKARAEPLRERYVPQGVRFLIATIDVQNNMFMVTIFGILPGAPFDMVVIDRYDVRYSKRLNEAGERLWIKPHSYLEDWDELIENVIEKEYPVDDDSGRMMGIKMTGCDSGGRAGATARAYEFWRKLRGENKHRRFILLKGEGTPGNPRCRITTPDSNQRDKNAIARGDVPVLIFNSNLLKDDLNGRLDCMEPGKGMFRTPNWLDDKFYAELCTEIRSAKGWENPAQHRNEAWDLAYYAIGLCVSELIRIEVISWSNPPSWAADWSNGGANDFVRKVEETVPFANTIKSSHNFSEYAKALA